MSQDHPDHYDHLALLRNDYQELTQDFLRLAQEKKIAENMTQAEIAKAEERLTQQKMHYENATSALNKRIKELEEQCSGLQAEQTSLHRKEVRKYVEGINEKEVEISSLKRQINGLKNKIGNLQQEVNNLTNARENYQIYVIKAVDQIRASIKENKGFLEDVQTEKMVLESKFRQLSEKTVLIQNHIQEVEAQKKTLEENYNKLKHLYKNSRDQCLELKYEVQKVKQMARNAELPLTLEEHINDEEVSIAKEIDNILELRGTMNQCEGFLLQTSQYAQLNEALITQNSALKIRNGELQGEVDEMKRKFQQGYEDNLLLQKQPSLYEFLLNKKEQIARFEKNMLKIESYMEEKDEKINYLISTFIQRQSQCSCGLNDQLQVTNDELAQTRRRADHLAETNLKLQREIQGYKDKIVSYVVEIKELLDPKLKKKKQNKMRCRVCMLFCDKDNPYQSCPDCKKNFHSQHCILNHVCDSYSLGDTNSNYSGVGQ